MPFLNRSFSVAVRALLLMAAALLPAACQQSGNGKASETPLSAVSPVPAPQRAAWIASYSPAGQTNTLAQIRIIFKTPLIALGQLESPAEQAKLASFKIEPQLPGHFRFLTPRMVGFQADRALPQATRVKVTALAGLTDLKNDRLNSDFAWTFTTQPVEITNLPGTGENTDPAPVAPDAGFDVTANTELDAASLAAHARFSPKHGSGETAATAVLKKTATPDPAGNASAAFDPSQNTYVYTIKPAQPLEKGSAYALTIAPGVAPAHGNLESAATFKGTFATYGPLRLTAAGTSQTDSPRFVRGDPELRFNNGLDAASALKAISISPAPVPGTRVLAVNDGDTTVAINPFALRPHTTYTVSIAADLKDQFGQTLGDPKKATISTSSLSPDFWAPGGVNIFASNTSLKLEYSAVNLPEGRYQAAYRALTPADVAGSAESDDATMYLPRQQVWPDATVHAADNQIVSIPVGVASKLGAATGVLAYGAAAAPHNSQSFYGIVGLTNLGVFAQWFPQSGSILVQRLSDGSPVAGAAVDVYRIKTRVPCATGTTGTQGTLEITGTQIERCSVGAQGDLAPSLVIAVRSGSDWTYTRVNDGTGYGYNLYLDWSNGKPASRGALFSDRQMYQPGERAAFTGAAYYLQNGVLKRDAGARYAVSISDANGKVASLGAQTADAFGIFSVRWTVPRTQALGSYTIKAKGPQGNELYGDFRVAEFKPPNFNVALKLDKAFATAGETVDASSKSAYLFGAPLQGGRAHYDVTRRQAYLAPKGWDDYQFGRQWFWPEQAPSIDTDVLQADATLDSAGAGSQSVSVPADLPFAMTYEVDLTVSDVSNLSVSDSQTFTALPDKNIIGLQNDFVGEENAPLPVKVIVTDAAGKPQSGVNVHLELQAMTYTSATQEVEGGESARNAVTYTTVDSADVTSADKAQSVSLKAAKAGSYRIRANFAGAHSDASATDTQIWISGSDLVRWNSENPSQLKVTLDKATYRAGETATALLQSPYAQADVYFSVVRDRAIMHKLVHVRGGAPRITFTVTPEMLPNAAVQAVLVRRGKPLQSLAPGSLDSLVRTGFAPFSTTLDAKYLKLAIAPQHAKVTPGSTQRVTLSLKDAAGRPAPGEFTVMVVNDAILQLTGYRLPDLVKTVYAEQPISTRFNDNRSNVVLSPLASPVAKGFGFGGGFMEGSGSTRVRRNFQQLAFYAGAVHAGANGTATIAFPMPDDLTTWRVMAVASGGTAADFRFATADATFISTKPLMLNPLLPQFARTGDVLDAGVAATNTTGTAGTLDLDAVLGGALRFSTGDPSKLTAQESMQSATQAFRFPMTAGSGASATMGFRGTLGGAGDAFSIPFEIRNAAVTETVAQSGATSDTVTIPIDFGSGGTLGLWMANSVIPQIVAPGERVLRDADPLPFSETSASRLGIAAALKELAARTGQRPSLDLGKEARNDLAALGRAQAADGGIGGWPGATSSDPILNAYVAENLGAAQQAGLASNAALASALRKLMSATLANPGRYAWCKDAQCKIFLRLQTLIGLAALGDRRTEFLSDINAQRDTLDVANRARLAVYLLRSPGWSAAGAALAAKLQENIALTARGAAANIPQRWSWYDAPDAAQANLLDAMVAAQAPADLTDGLVRTLTAQHCTCRYTNTYATAIRLRALAAYARTQENNPDFSVAAAAGGRNVAEASFTSSTAPPKHVNVKAAQLNGARALQLSKRGRGTLHYVVDYTYTLPGPQPGALGGLRVTRSVRAANGTTVLAQMGLQKPDGPVSLPASNVFDIGLEVIADHPVDNLVMTDALPAGLEAVDASFQTSNPALRSASDSWQIDYQTIYKDRVVAFAGHLDAGVYVFHYLVRSVTPGTYAWPGGEAHAQYAPEDFGRTAASVLTVTP